MVEPEGRVIVGTAVEAARGAFAEAGIPDPGVASAPNRNDKTRFVLWATAPR